MYFLLYYSYYYINTTLWTVHLYKYVNEYISANKVTEIPYVFAIYLSRPAAWYFGLIFMYGEKKGILVSCIQWLFQGRTQFRIYETEFLKYDLFLLGFFFLKTEKVRILSN